MRRIRRDDFSIFQGIILLEMSISYTVIFQIIQALKDRLVAYMFIVPKL